MGHKLRGTEEEYPREGFHDRLAPGSSSPARTRDFLPGGDIWPTPTANRGTHTISRCFYGQIFFDRKWTTPQQAARYP